MRCPNPDKSPYLTLRDATVIALEWATEFDTAMRPYECECGKFHLTSKGMNGAALTTDQVAFLAESLGIIKEDAR
jgi:hypothetical protein